VTACVVDASVAIKWFLPEIHAADARRLLTGEFEMLAPDLIYPEVGNVLWKRVRSGEITEEEALAVLHSFGAIDLSISPSWPLAAASLVIACESRRTVYDSLYVALAIRERAPLITADERFFNALRGTKLDPHVLWVGDLPRGTET
jgi:predicted nucleic acid-binding protein